MTVWYLSGASGKAARTAASEGLPVGLMCQPGNRNHSQVERYWRWAADNACFAQGADFDALFIGGSTAWKTSEHAARLCSEARHRGKWVHMGRVNSLQRLRTAEQFGCNSVDGTYLAFGPDTNAKKLRRWLGEIERQPSLWAEVQP